MTSIGPQMPPSPSKRKRTPDNQEDESPPTKQARNTDEIDINDDNSSDDGFGPSAPAAQGSSAPKTAAGPSLPPTAKTNTDEIDLDASDNDDDDDYGPSASSAAATASASKPSIGPSLPPKRTIGPSLPPPADSLTAESPTVHAPGADSDASDSEDDYAPALPGSKAAQAHLAAQSRAAALAALEPAAAPAAPQRDDWMLAPPPAAAGYSERDPSKLKNRRFASNKPHASAPAGGPAEISSIWTETPEQKRKRLEDAVLGRTAPAGSELERQGASAAGAAARPSKEQERARRTAENLEAVRGKSLYETHATARKEGGRRKDEEEEDDPSARAFDREKDMALGGSINSTQRRELLGKAKDFGGRFQKGSFL
ncbi:hypothetical protein D7B24_009075 [Verticillium nonalfalfae]|uniref:DUF3752 domain-containing protein n=1 Tax=Verticillium nonalfalfae TaxID=1051616 RepID=A0A3M9Y3Q1_9PEZI|nr:uncharacterized protein D7B24_009075 [Verticillium nonalfalfae]RNJ55057.1 hypothetical protein D7B24_009075 [Verticillium nonalfalfae]